MILLGLSLTYKTPSPLLLEWLMIQKLLELHNDSIALPTSCKENKQKQPNNSFGVYLLVTANRTSLDLYHAYCNIGTPCGLGGGWTRLA